MSDIPTVITLPGYPGSGFMEYGRLDRNAMILKLKTKALQDRAVADKIIHALNEQFDVKIVRGSILQHLVKQL